MNQIRKYEVPEILRPYDTVNVDLLEKQLRTIPNFWKELGQSLYLSFAPQFLLKITFNIEVDTKLLSREIRGRMILTKLILESL